MYRPTLVFVRTTTISLERLMAHFPHHLFKATTVSTEMILSSKPAASIHFEIWGVVDPG